MTRRRKEDGKRRKGLRQWINANLHLRKPPAFVFENPETGEQVAVTQFSTHHGRVSGQHRHHTRTRAGQTYRHPLQGKAKRRRRAKLAAASRRANRSVR